MHVNLIAPPDLIPLVSARLAFNPPANSYSLHPISSKLDQLQQDTSILFIQSNHAEQAKELKQYYPHVSDAFLMPSPLAPMYGFMLCASGSTDDLATVHSLLDQLAPIRDGWLHLGGLGACGFLHQLWQAIVTPQGCSPFMGGGTIANWQNIHPSTQIQNLLLNHPELLTQLSSFLAQQQLQTQTLASLARRYLTENPPQAFTPYHRQDLQLFGQLNQSNLSPIHQLAQLLAQY
ncbi:hypothetical protein [Chitinibacter sp. S2-10]|uniref:hypothetical protein n=1 Tax=Chitinibacter sp. S2-10 TaxID=3373597 RepID=UPI0039773D3F